MFIGLHEHTHYSNGRLKDAISKVKELIDYNHELGNMGTCITEHECISSAIEAQKYFFEKKKTPGWENDKLLLGNEIYLCEDNLNENSEQKEFNHFILVALDEIGHEQIRILSTRAWLRSFKYKGMTRVPTYYNDLFEVIGGNPGHIVGSTACLGGALPKQLLRALEAPSEFNLVLKKCRTWIYTMNELFGEGKFFLEMQPSRSKEQMYVNKQLLRLSNETFVPYIITTDVHYIKKEDAAIHKVFLESQEGDRETEKFYATTYCMGEQEIHEYMDNNIGNKEVQIGLDNTMLVYNMAQEYDLQKELHIPYMPLDVREPSEKLYLKYKDEVPLFEYYYTSKCDSDRHLLRRLLEEIEKDEYSRTKLGYEKIQECLDYLKISSEKMCKNWSAYLLSVADYVELCWEAGSIVGPGRGSGVGYRLLYMLGITQVDPIREKTATYPWRFLNPERVTVLDIDIDVNPTKKEEIVARLKERYRNVCRVATFSTEKSRSAIQSAARGLGYNDDYALYLGSLIASDRGQLRTLSQMYFGDEDYDFEPDITFVSEMSSHPDLWEAAQKIEGLIKGCSSHAGGVIIADEPFTKSTALMKTSSGEIITQFDLHECEEVGLIKIDLLVTDFIAKEQMTLELLLKDKVIQWQGSLKDTYEKYLGVYTLERNATDMWKMLWDKKIYSFFQMEKESGIQAVALTRPQSVDDLTVINSVMRLMAQGENMETPLEKYARFKGDISEWYKDMDEADLTKEEQMLLRNMLDISYGICESQEKLMMLPQIPEVGGMSLTWADKLRKSVAKKKPKEFMELEQAFFENARIKGLSEKLTKYVWYNLIYTQRGYGFNASHALAYSICGLQCLNLCWKYHIIYWNTACLIIDSGSLEGSEDNKGAKVGKMAVAIANMQKSGINISLPLINEAEFGFVPDVENNRIIFSLKAISGVGDETARAIMANRPFSSMEDFLERMVDTKIITPAKMIQLIKAGCFVKLDNCDQSGTMMKYINHYLFKRTDKLTFAHIGKLKAMGLILDKRMIELARIPAFIDYVINERNVRKTITETNTKRKLPQCNYFDRYLVLDNISQPFFISMYSRNSVIGVAGEYFLVSEKKFLKDSNKLKEELSTWFNNSQIVDAFNKIMFESILQRCASGTVSSWEMNALSYYYSGHELLNIDEAQYGIENYFNMPEEPVPYDYYPRYINGEKKWLSKNRILRIAGTVVDSDNDKHVVTLLSTDGIVNVKFSKSHYAFYNKKVSEIITVTGKKKGIEDSWFKRGTKIIVSGYRNGFNFRAYRYSDTIYTHIVSKIESINADGSLDLRTERVII